MVFTGPLQKVSARQLAKLADAVNVARDELNAAGQANLEGPEYAAIKARFDQAVMRYRDALGY